MVNICITSLARCVEVNFKLYFLIYVFKMPFYAVAVGKTPGIYKTWAECEKQTKGYPKAKYKKFNTQAEAVNFVTTKGSEISMNSLAKPTLFGNSISTSEIIKVAKSGSTKWNTDRFTQLSDKFNEFVEETNRRFNEFKEQLALLKDQADLSQSRTDKKRKQATEVSSESEDSELVSSSGKRKRTCKRSDEVDILDDKGNASISATTAKNGSLEQVDGPWNGQGFIMDCDGFVIVYTDGACTNNGRSNAKAGLGVWFNHNHPFNVARPVIGVATNNNAEIQAATRAIEQANLAGIKRLNIHTDSQFMINCINNWMKKWKKNNWVTSKGEAVKNKEQLEILNKAIQTMDAVKWTHVRGHVGLEGNECADSLARAGASM